MVFCLEEKKGKKLMVTNKIQSKQQTNVAEIYWKENIKGE